VASAGVPVTPEGGQRSPVCVPLRPTPWPLHTSENTHAAYEASSPKCKEDGDRLPQLMPCPNKEAMLSWGRRRDPVQVIEMHRWAL